MGGYMSVFAVVRRDQYEDYKDFFRNNGAASIYGTLCEGAARQKLLDMLGLERKEKLMLFCVVPGSKLKHILTHLRTEMRIDAPNNGIAMFTSLECIGGASALRQLCSEELIIGNEVKEMKENHHSLIVAIAEQGHTGDVMDAAYEAGATGGTIIRARGTAADHNEKFFGVSIAEEKEIVYILTPEDKRAAIMTSIMHKAGHKSPAKAIVMALPIEAVAGIRQVYEEE